MSSAEFQSSETRLAPPYVSFQSVKSALAQFKEHVVPDRIDRSVLSKFSGAVGGQILTAFKFLALTDSSGHSTDLLRELVKAYGTDEWPVELEKVLRQAYPPIFTLNLTSCSPSQFMEKFKSSYQGADDVLRKSVTFFLNAANDAKIPISSFIMKARKPRSAPSRKRSPKSDAQRGVGVNVYVDRDEDADENEENTPPASLLAPEFMTQLLEKFPTFDPAWPEAVQVKWFEAFDNFMSRVDPKDKK